MTLTLPYKKCWRVIFCFRNGFFVAFSLLFSHSAISHDIPSSLTLHAYIKPQAQDLTVLVRVPMDAFSEIDFPKRGPGFLDFEQLDSVLRDLALSFVADSMRLYENDQQLPEPDLAGFRVSLPNNTSFASYLSALENFSRQALDNGTDLYWSQGFFDIWFVYAIQSEQSRFAIDSNLSRLGIETTTVLRFVLPDGGERLFNYLGDPGRVDLDPSLWQSIWRFIVLGFDHILDGLDHLLFLFCLVIPIRNIRALVPVITAFTVAHSITLISSAFGLVPNVLWFAPMIETLIALSIVYMAFENIVGVDFSKRWLITFGFGLVHGFGFSFVLAETMQFAGGHLFSALLAFNVGVEFGQLFVLIIVVPLLGLLFHYIRQQKIALILLSALVAHTAWHWLLARGDALLQYEFTWPVLDAMFFAGLLRWLMLLVFVVGVVWLMFGFFGRLHLIGPGVIPADNKKTQ